MSQPSERTVVAPAPPPPLTSPSVAGAFRIVDAGPRYLYRAAVVSLAGTSALTIALAWDIRPAGNLHVQQRELMELGLVGLILAAALILTALAGRAVGHNGLLDRVAAPEQRAAIWLALAVWFPLLLVPAYYRTKSTLPTRVVWIAFGYMDKRWITATYLVGALAPMLLLVIAARVLAAGRAHPQSWRGWMRGIAPAPRVPGQNDQAHRPAAAATAATAAPSSAWWSAPPIRVAVGVLTAVGIAYYFYGPPWYLSRSAGSGPIGGQEDVFLTGLQAISKGTVPYMGPASVQYGPGAQLLSYLYMRHIGGFSVLGFRESWAMLEWVGATIFFVVLFLALGYGRGLVASLMSALIYPALHLVGFLPGRGYTGFWGWADPLRYVGAIALILLLPAVIRRPPSWRGLAGAAVLGLLWGALSYVAQENLIAGAVGALVVGALMLFSGTSPWRSVWTVLLAALAGFAVSWLPVLVYYAAKGLLTRFVYLYFLITRAVAEGYSNTPYGGSTKGQISTDAPWRTIFYDLPWLLAVVALLAVVDVRPFRIATEWSVQRITLVAAVLTTILLYQGALLRSDALHLTGTLLIAPAFVVTVASLLPRLLGGRRRVTLLVAGAAIVAASFALLPSHIYRPSAVRAEAVAPYQDRQRLAAATAQAAPATLAAQRVGAGAVDSLACCQHVREPMPEFLLMVNRIHAIVGNRVVYVADFPGGYPGAIYFVADLRPAPIPMDPYTMVFTVQQRRVYMATFRRTVLPHIQAFITADLTTPEAHYFLHRYPQAKKITLGYSGQPYYVLLAS